MDKLLSMIGLAYKAGKIKFGAEGVIESIRGRYKPGLVLLASDASPNSVKKVTDGCTFHKVPLMTAYVTKQEIGHVLKGRSDVACVAVTDVGFASAISNLITSKTTEQTISSGGVLNDD